MYALKKFGKPRQVCNDKNIGAEKYENQTQWRTRYRP